MFFVVSISKYSSVFSYVLCSLLHSTFSSLFGSFFCFEFRCAVSSLAKQTNLHVLKFMWVFVLRIIDFFFRSFSALLRWISLRSCFVQRAQTQYLLHAWESYIYSIWLSFHLLVFVVSTATYEKCAINALTVANLIDTYVSMTK